MMMKSHTRLSNRFLCLSKRKKKYQQKQWNNKEYKEERKKKTNELMICIFGI